MMQTSQVTSQQQQRAPLPSMVRASTSIVGGVTKTMLASINAQLLPEAPPIARRPRAYQLASKVATLQQVCGQVVCLAMMGHLAGWDLGMAYGWPSMLAAYVIATVLFWLVGLTLAEMSCCLPFAGGSATFALAAFGDEVATMQGLTSCISYCSGAAWAVVSLGRSIAFLCSFPPWPNNMEPVTWIVLLQLVMLTTYRTHYSLQFALTFGLTCCAVLVAYIVTSFMHAPMVTTSAYSFTATPITFSSVMAALPFAFCFYRGIETVSLSAEESVDHIKASRRVMTYVMAALAACGLLVLCLTTGLMPPLAPQMPSAVLNSLFFQLGMSTAPVAGYIGAAVMVLPTLGAAHAGLSASARHLYSLGRAGVLARSLSYTLSGSPVYANHMSACITFAVALLVFAVTQGDADGMARALIQLTMWLACVTYAVDMLAFVRLRRSHAGAGRRVSCRVLARGR
ncbi:hypothetical protein RI367_006069 [Sorochytrium milnesiophthora]